MEDQQSLLQPLLPVTATAFSRSSHYSIFIRLLLVLLVAVISLWANHEASKTFDITIINDAKDSPATKRFALFYVSNDRATRIVLNTSSFVENLLYPNDDDLNQRKKHIDRVTLRLSGRNLNPTVMVTAAGKHNSGGESFNGYIVDISPSLLEERNHDRAIVSAVQRAMGRVWLYDGESRAPSGLLDGMVEYIAELAMFGREYIFSGAVSGGDSPKCEERGWWEDEDPRAVARCLHYCGGYRNGFIQRLNQAMRSTWHNHIVDDVLGMPAKKLCGLHNASALHPIY